MTTGLRFSSAALIQLLPLFDNAAPGKIFLFLCAKISKDRPYKVSETRGSPWPPRGGGEGRA